MIFAVRLVNIRERHIIVGWSLQKKIICFLVSELSAKLKRSTAKLEFLSSDCHENHEMAKGNFLLLEESDLVLFDWLIKQSLLFFLQSFDEGLELIFASAMVSGNKF